MELDPVVVSRLASLIAMLHKRTAKGALQWRVHKSRSTEPMFSLSTPNSTVYLSVDEMTESIALRVLDESGNEVVDYYSHPNPSILDPEHRELDDRLRDLHRLVRGRSLKTVEVLDGIIRDIERM